MVGLPNPLAMFQHHKETKGPKPPKAPKKARSGDDDDEDGDDKPELLPEVASKFSSSCEIFNVFKVLAAGKGNRHTLAEDVDSDESEDEPSSEPRSSAEGSLRHVGSTRTVRPGDALHDDDGEDDDDHHTVVGGEPEMDKEETLRRWQSSFGSSTAELDAQGNRLAALQIGNLRPGRPPTIRSVSSFRTARETSDSDSEDEHPELGRSGKPAQPALPAIKTQDLGPPIKEVQEELDLSEEPATSSSATSSGNNSSPATPYEHDAEEKQRWEGTREKEMSETRKLQVIIEEFGEMSTLMETLDGKPAESERIIAESHGSLYRGVMTIGNLHLTTHRLLFHAMLPPDTALANGVAENGESSNQHHSILYSGPVTVHRPGLLPPVRRWFELTSDMVTSYPRADEAGRIRPLRCVLLSNVRRMEPFDPEHPTDFHMVYETPSGIQKTHLSVDTEQSAMQWRRAFEGALFRYAASQWKLKQAQRLGVDVSAEDKDKWTMVRACVPLDRVTISGVQDYHSFVTLLGLEIDLDDVDTINFDPSNEVNRDDPVEQQLHQSIDGGQYHKHAPPHEAHAQRQQPQTQIDPVKRTFSLRRTDSPTTISSPASTETGSDLTQRSTKKVNDGTASTPASSPGIDTPTKRFSLRNTIERAFTPTHSRDPSPTRKQSAPKWIDTTVPGPLAKATKLSIHDSADPDAPPEVEAEYSFNIAVHTDQNWFVHSFEQAVDVAKQRRYKAGVKRPKMVFNVAGHNCLITDEELDHPIERHVSITSDEDEVEQDESPPSEVDRTQKTIKATRKAEKTSMAAKVFGLDEADGIWLKRCFVLQGVLPCRGHLIVSPRFLCFWRRATFGNDIKYRFKTNDVKQVVECASIQIGYHGLALKIAGHHDLRLEFRFKAARAEAMSHIQTMIDTASANNSPSLMSADSPSTPSERPPSIHSSLNAPVGEAVDVPDRDHPADILAPPKEALFKTRAWPDEALSYMPFVANKPRESATRLSPRTFAMLTIGSRGDVQPYIALALRLKKDGHKVVIITHDEFKTWVEGYGIIHRQAGGDPTALMKLSQEHAMFSPGFFKESLGSFRQWLDDLLLDAWKACHDADVLIESPSAMAGVHIAEARHIPYFRAFTMPWTRTNAYPQAFMVPAFEMGPSFNYSTYVLFDNIIWAATSGQINRWRKDYLGLKSTDMSSLSITKVPFLYNFSSAVVPKPLDWRDDITITGYWNLEDSDTDWTPPKGLDEFMKKARDDGKPLVYIGFGSIVVPRPNAMTKSIIKAVEKADVRAIIAKGWSSRGGDPAKEGQSIEFPESCFSLEKVPHGWLFPRIDAALHHGGAGTVGASLRAGIPTLIKPWFGDQYFWQVPLRANRVTKLEVGLKVPSLRSDEIAHCLIKATSSTLMIEKAKRVGQLIRSEHGVDNAVAAIQFNIVRAAADRRKMSYQK